MREKLTLTQLKLSELHQQQRVLGRVIQSLILDALLENNELHNEKINKLENHQNSMNTLVMMMIIQSPIMNLMAKSIWSCHNWMLKLKENNDESMDVTIP